MMINQDFDQFINAQEKHKARHLAGANTKKDKNDKSASSNSDISVGAEGRTVRKK